MQEELVSIVMATYNSGIYLSESIESVLKQTYPHWELLITDDCSNDAVALDTLAHYEQLDPRIHVFHFDTNKGPGAARNNSIEHAQGRFIAFCDSDDRWMPDKLEKQVAFMLAKGAILSFTPYYTCRYEGAISGYVDAPSKLTLTDLKHDNKIGCLTAMYDTSRFGKFYMPTIRKRQDWAFFLTILKECKEAYGLGEPLAIYRKTPGSVSRRKVPLLKYNAEIYRIVFGYSKCKAYLYLFFIFLPNYFFKVLRNRLMSHHMKGI